MEILLTWLHDLLYYDANKFSLMFELSGNMDLFQVHQRLRGKCESVNNLENFN
jgi:hypothetical protein